MQNLLIFALLTVQNKVFCALFTIQIRIFAENIYNMEKLQANFDAMLRSTPTVFHQIGRAHV